MEIGCYRSSSNVPSRDSFHEDDEEALKWAALEKLPTYNRARKAILHGITGESKEVDLQDLDFEQRTDLLNRVIKTADNNEEFLQKLKKRIDRVSLNLPTIEVRFQNLNVEGEAYMGSRALPSISNFFLDLLEGLFHRLHILPSQKRKFHILNGVSGIINPGRMTLLLGPPGSGKSTLLQALSGKLDPQLKFSGKVTYNGHEMNEFVPQRTSAYISQYDVHFPLLTVRETLQFSARCQGVGTSYDMITELLRREKLLNIKPDPYIDALMKAAVLKEHREFIATEYILKILGMEGCADTIVGDDMTRGISGGQKKRVTTGEMLVGPVNAFFMDNISTGLDSSTTYQIINSIRQSIHIFKKTGFISLLQPPPETFELFDDIILLSEGKIVYQGPRESVLEFFESVGFKCPKRKAVADFLQEVTSKKDQRHYWMNEEQQYHYISVTQFAEAFKSFHLGKTIEHDLETPFDKSKSHPAALTRTKYGANKLELLKACLSRETILMKRSAFVFILQIIQLEINAIILTTVYAQAKKHKNSVEDGNVYMGALFFAVNVITFSGFLELPMTIDKLPIFYKQRDLLMYPSWAFSLPTSILRIPISIVEVAFWIATTYYSLGYDPGVIRMFRQYVILALSGQMSYALFRTIAAISRDHIVANTGGCLSVIWLLLFSGFIISRESVHTWLVWGIYTSPLMYAQTALSVNEFFGGTWNHVLNGSKEALGVSVLKSRGVIPNPNWYWIGLAALIFFTIAFIVMSALALAYLDPFGTSQVVFIPQDSDEEENSMDKVDDQITGSTNNSLLLQDTTLDGSRGRKGMLVPFKQLSLTFENITYSVDMPKAMKAQGHIENRLMLLKGVSGAFKPGVLTALMGVSGAGKTTLLDVLAGRKNSGYIEGNINISGYPKKQSTFARISGYCEQNDIHSPLVTVYESLLYSAFLRLPSDVDSNAKAHFVEEMMELVELMQLRDALVGFPNVNGLSIEQRKRLTIAVELVANPSIIFMDEPTSGLDARAAAIVMRVVRNTVDTGRTVVCTIHQPSIDIFESFDELILLARGGEEIYVGPIGTNSCHLIKYLEDIKGVGKIRDGYNPATWALEVTTTAQEQVLGVKFADIYKESILFRRNKTTIKELSRGLPGSQDIQFSSEYPRSYVTQFKVCLWKQYKSYWRNTSYTAVRLLFSAAMAIMFGIVFWGLGSKRNTRQEILNGLGAMYMANMFLGAQSAASIRPVLITERTVYYREKAAGMYSALPFALAQVVIEIPCTLVQAIIYGVIVYAMIGDQWTATKFFLNMFFLFITLLYYIYSAMMFLAASPNQESASIFSGVIHATWNLFAGFVIPRKRIAVWWRWYVWICPAAWSLYGMAASQYGDVETRLDSGETVAEFMRDYLGFHYDFIWVAALAIIGYIFLFATLYIYSSKFFNFQKR